MSPVDRRLPIWLFDLDDTLHDASGFTFKALHAQMTHYIARHLQLTLAEADGLRSHYWRRYGATLVGLVKHHGVNAAHFLAATHDLPDATGHLRACAADRRAIQRLPGRKLILTNAPVAYAQRVLQHMKMAQCFERIISIESMQMFRQWRPKPDVRMLRAVLARNKLPPHRCVLVDDSLSNHRSAHGMGLKTVWMQRYSGAMSHGAEVGVRARNLPRCVHAKMKALQRLQRLHV